MLLCADLHLDDRTQNEYRWQVFSAIQAWIETKADDQYTPCVVIAGDLGDRKDRHSAVLVNRLVDELQKLVAANRCDIVCLRGNHDAPVAGPAFWNILNAIPRVYFYTEPTLAKDVLFLPWTANPATDWHDLPLVGVKCIIMHQPTSGAVGNNGYKIQADGLPIFPRGVRVYSGDIHTAQKVGQVQYIGAPHPVAFGDDYPCRMLELDDNTYDIVQVISLAPPAKLMIELHEGQSLNDVLVTAGDQARVRIKVPLNQMAQWPAQEAKIREWALNQGVALASIEPEIIEPESVMGESIPMADDYQILREFIQFNKVPNDLAEAGHAMLKAAQP
jgi:hypothetical protein